VRKDDDLIVIGQVAQERVHIGALGDSPSSLGLQHMSKNNMFLCERTLHSAWISVSSRSMISVYGRWYGSGRGSGSSLTALGSEKC